MAAPTVREPLNPAPFLNDVCTAISPQRAQSLGLKTPGSDETSTAIGQACSWQSLDQTFSAHIGFMSTIKNGLSHPYQNRDRDPTFYAYFEPTQIDGCPAVYAGTIDNRKDGNCILDVGVTDSLYAQVTAFVRSGPRKMDPCPVVAEVAQAMIATIKEGP